ncbi:MAG: Sec-independent protein translocase protein TatB [Dehalococcoidales bacterium]|nr:Sec-independent protein translocase protein TatB [Dehalococcoidales bacterium]
MGFFDMGFFEILVVMVVALLVIGPDKLPEYARKFGKMVRDLKKMTNNLTGEITRSLDLEGEVDELKRTALGMKGSLDEESLKIKKALDLEADEIARTVDLEVAGVKKAINEGTEDLAAMPKTESTEFNKIETPPVPENADSLQKIEAAPAADKTGAEEVGK